MIKPRVIPVLVTAAITASVLFGGWALYKQVAVAAPLEKAVKSAAGIESASKPVLTPDKVSVEVVLSPNANVKDVYDEIEHNGAKDWGNRKLELTIKSESNEIIDDIWSTSLFAVAEAMETKTYSGIPEAIELAASKHKDVSVLTEMDDSYVYVTLKQGDAVKYVVLPRTASTLEVW